MLTILVIIIIGIGIYRHLKRNDPPRYEDTRTFGAQSPYEYGNENEWDPVRDGRGTWRE